MKKVITYGTFDLLHQGHIRLLERAKKLGDYLIVGITADDFDRQRGKINVQQSLSERIANVKAIGLADQIIIEEYEGQKIDDIQRFNVNIFVIGSDWEGKFEYLKSYCEVIYLDRTVGISSSKLRSRKNKLRLGIIGSFSRVYKFINEAKFINGVEVSGICTKESSRENLREKYELYVTDNYKDLLEKSDAIYIASELDAHYTQVRIALLNGKHVICELPVVKDGKQYDELLALAQEKKCILMSSLKTAYATAYYRLLLLIKSGQIGDVMSISAVCTSLAQQKYIRRHSELDIWGSMAAWGACAMLPIFQILGTDYISKNTTCKQLTASDDFDLFTKTDYTFRHAVATFLVGKGIKAEGQLIISGTKGYILVPAPWWKTDYFEIRYENTQNNKRIFYQLEGEGIRYELLEFVKAIKTGRPSPYISNNVSRKICDEFKDFNNGNLTINIFD